VSTGYRCTLSLYLTALGWVTLAHAEEGEQALAPVVVQATAMPGNLIDIDKIPGNVQVLSADDLQAEGSASLTRALNANLSSLNINDDLDDPFQPDILYRGFEASPVLGTPQGLAVYQNGVRINEAFGDTVNWDLFPDIAIDRVELTSSNPTYGLNALGGAISVTMKNGFTYQGAEAELSGGSFGQREITAQFGGHYGIFGLYVAGRSLDWNGWRNFSSDKTRNIYVALSAHTDAATADLSFTRADNTLNGQGAAPLQELAISRALTFTGPQANVNQLSFINFNGSAKLNDSWSAQAVAYYRSYSQTVSNGDTSDYEPCADGSGVLCQPDGTTPLTNASGATLPDITAGGAAPLGQNDYENIHAWGRGASLQISDEESFFGHHNNFAIGAAFDYASTSFFTGTQLGVINADLLVLPSALTAFTAEDSDAAADNGDPTPVSVDSVNRNLGLYFADTFDVIDGLSVTASGRYNIAHVDLYDQLGDNLSGHNRFVHFNPSIGATYRVLPVLTVYANVSQNNRTPTASEIECSDPATPCLLPTNLAGDPPLLRQVVSHTTEIGARGRLPNPLGVQGQLSWNLSLYRTFLHDDIDGIATSVSQGYFQNIGDTRRQGLEAGLKFAASRWSAFLNYSLVKATFESALTVPSPSNPFQDDAGDIAVTPGDQLPGIPEHRLKLGADYRVLPQWNIGATASYVSSSYYVGDEANLLAPLPGYTVVNLHTTYQPVQHVEIFASIFNLLNRHYATFGILSDPTGIGTPGVPADADSNDPAVDNRFQSPAPPFEVFGGVRVRF
jgi:iron complex outermembrane receptor protein